VILKTDDPFDEQVKKALENRQPSASPVSPREVAAKDRPPGASSRWQWLFGMLLAVAVAVC
jgi:hypothetical protein